VRRAFLAAAVILGCGGSPRAGGPADPAAPREDGGIDVTLTTADGIKLAATHWL
jgi:hypothetical protein